MKEILIFFHDFEINSNSTKSIPRLLAGVIGELEKTYKITFVTFLDDYKDPQIQTCPEVIHIKFSDRLRQKFINTIRRKKIIKEFYVRRKSVMRDILKNKKFFDVIIVPGLDDVNFLRTNFRDSTIIYWIHGISAIYNKEYLKHINKVDYLWSPTKTVYKKIVEELHPVPFLAEFQLIPNWAENFFDINDKTVGSEIKMKHKISRNSKVFIFCGGEVKLKGWFLMKQVLKQLAQKNNTCITVLATGGRVLDDEIYSSDVRVIYPGTLEPTELLSYYQAAEFGLFPSLGGYEHAPVTIIEMIQCGVLPIASDVGGVKEMLGEEYDFLIDAPHSIELWRNTIEKVLTLKEEEKHKLLAGLHKRMEEYKKKDFVNLISNIITRDN